MTPPSDAPVTQAHRDLYIALRHPLVQLEAGAQMLANFERDVADGRVKTLRAALENYVENDTTPKPNCSCHLAPPCSDCVEFGGARETLETAKAALAATTL